MSKVSEETIMVLYQDLTEFFKEKHKAFWSQYGAFYDDTSRLPSIRGAANSILTFSASMNQPFDMKDPRDMENLVQAIANGEMTTLKEESGPTVEAATKIGQDITETEIETQQANDAATEEENPPKTATEGSISSDDQGSIDEDTQEDSSKRAWSFLEFSSEEEDSLAPFDVATIVVNYEMPTLEVCDLVDAVDKNHRDRIQKRLSYTREVATNDPDKFEDWLQSSCDFLSMHEQDRMQQFGEEDAYVVARRGSTENTAASNTVEPNSISRLFRLQDNSLTPYEVATIVVNQHLSTSKMCMLLNDVTDSKSHVRRIRSRLYYTRLVAKRNPAKFSEWREYCVKFIATRKNSSEKGTSAREHESSDSPDKTFQHEDGARPCAAERDTSALWDEDASIHDVFRIQDNSLTPFEVATIVCNHGKSLSELCAILDVKEETHKKRIISRLGYIRTIARKEPIRFKEWLQFCQSYTVSYQAARTTSHEQLAEKDDSNAQRDTAALREEDASIHDVFRIQDNSLTPFEVATIVCNHGRSFSGLCAILDVKEETHKKRIGGRLGYTRTVARKEPIRFKEWLQFCQSYTATYGAAKKMSHEELAEMDDSSVLAHDRSRDGGVAHGISETPYTESEAAGSSLLKIKLKMASISGLFRIQDNSLTQSEVATIVINYQRTPSAIFVLLGVKDETHRKRVRSRLSYTKHIAKTQPTKFNEWLRFCNNLQSRSKKDGELSSTGQTTTCVPAEDSVPVATSIAAPESQSRSDMNEVDIAGLFRLQENSLTAFEVATVVVNYKSLAAELYRILGAKEDKHQAKIRSRLAYTKKIAKSTPSKFREWYESCHAFLSQKRTKASAIRPSNSALACLAETARRTLQLESTSKGSVDPKATKIRTQKVQQCPQIQESKKKAPPSSGSPARGPSESDCSSTADPMKAHEKKAPPRQSLSVDAESTSDASPPEESKKRPPETKLGRPSRKRKTSTSAAYM